MRLIALATLICFLTLTALGNACSLLCIPICETANIEACENPESFDCRAGCFSEPATEVEPEPSNCLSCCPSETSLAETRCSPCSPQVKQLCQEMCRAERMPCKTECGKCIMPRLVSTAAESRIQMPELDRGEVQVSGYSIDNSLQYPLINDYLPLRIHSTISTTVLRL